MQLSPLESAFTEFNSPTLTGFDTSNAQFDQRIGGQKNRQMVRFYNKKFLVPVTVKAKIDEKTGTSTPLKVEMQEREYLMVHIVTPGDKNTFNDRAEEYHKREYYDHYAAFKSGTGIPLGTDIDNVAWIPSATSLELKYRNCHTLEQLADASDILVESIAEGGYLRDLAKAQLKADQENAQSGHITLMQKELAASHEVIKQLKEQMNALEEKMTAPVEKKGK
jgi:hypothetical protein